jgi:Flp pilus assembly protein TadB
MLIHAVPLPKQALQHLIGMTQPLWMVFCLFVALFTTSLSLGWWNERRKRQQRETRDI